jgi:hypothetical protein
MQRHWLYVWFEHPRIAAFKDVELDNDLPARCVDSAARVQLKAKRQLVAMTYYGTLGKRPTILLNLSPERGFFSSATWTWVTPTTTSGLVWNGTVTLY